jgi:coatomer subunit beta'
LQLAEECLIQAKDYSGLLLLFSSAGNPQGLLKLATVARDAGKNNIAFVCLFVLRRLEDCLQLLCDTQRLPEAAFFAHTYLPSHIAPVLALWKDDLRAKGHPVCCLSIHPIPYPAFYLSICPALPEQKAAEALADPSEYPNLFPDLDIALKVCHK